MQEVLFVCKFIFFFLILPIYHLKYISPIFTALSYYYSPTYSFLRQWVFDKSRGQLNIIHTRICFSNTNRTNLTNCSGYDPVCIRGIREICGHLNIIQTLICFSNTNRTNNTNLASAWHLLSLGQ